MSAEALTLAWRDGEVSALRQRPEDARATLIMAHGAGGSLATPTLAAVAERLVARGIEVVRFNFPYREAGKKAPDRQPVLEACYADVASAVARSADRLYLGGASMGGRIATHIVSGGIPAAGLVLQSYPLHPPGKPERIRDAHLAGIAVPMLFLWGTRDPFATPDLLRRSISALPGATLRPIEGGDHSLRVRGRPSEDVADEVAAAIDAFVG